MDAHSRTVVLLVISVVNVVLASRAALGHARRLGWP